MPYPPVCSEAGWTGAPPQVFPAAPPMPNCIGPAAPALLAPEWTPGASDCPLFGFDFADAGQDLPGDAVLAAGLLVEGEVAGRDRGQGERGGGGLGGAGGGLLGRDAGGGGDQQHGQHQQRDGGGEPGAHRSGGRSSGVAGAGGLDVVHGPARRRLDDGDRQRGRRGTGGPCLADPGGDGEDDRCRRPGRGPAPRRQRPRRAAGRAATARGVAAVRASVPYSWLVTMGASRASHPAGDWPGGRVR